MRILTILPFFAFFSVFSATPANRIVWFTQLANANGNQGSFDLRRHARLNRFRCVPKTSSVRENAPQKKGPHTHAGIHSLDHRVHHLAVVADTDHKQPSFETQPRRFVDRHVPGDDTEPRNDGPVRDHRSAAIILAVTGCVEGERRSCTRRNDSMHRAETMRVG